jgi:hypothetical protein
MATGIEIWRRTAQAQTSTLVNVEMALVTKRLDRGAQRRLVAAKITADVRVAGVAVATIGLPPLRLSSLALVCLPVRQVPPLAW